jgi:hypothetical protein
MTHPFELDQEQLTRHLDDMVRITISDLESEFLGLPKGEGFIEYADFRDGLEILKRHTDNFTEFTISTVGEAVRVNSRVLVVLRTILGMTPPEWSDLARTELGLEVGQTPARNLDRNCRSDPNYLRRVEERHNQKCAKAASKGNPATLRPKSLDRADALIAIAVNKITEGAPSITGGLIHRLDKFDTAHGLESVRHAANEGVPYAVVLYERYLGRPFAGHRDAVSELVGEVMENAVEERLRVAGITYRKTKRAERIPGYEQAPDFCIPDGVSPVVVIEAKITSDDGTARDKVTRIKNLATQRSKQVAEQGFRPYQVVACIDGRGFRVRSEDMRQLLVAAEGKVFTTATLDQLIDNTRLKELSTPHLA